jgi:hypothetical protein
MMHVFHSKTQATVSISMHVFHRNFFQIGVEKISSNPLKMMSSI